MPTSLPDNATQRRSQPATVTRRAFFRFFVPTALLAPSGAKPSTFTALGDTDVVQRWLRCSFAAPRLSFG